MKLTASKLIDGAERVLLTAWVGGLWAVGFLVAPVLFAALAERAAAGELAGRLFALLAQVGLVCALLLLGLQGWRERRDLLRAWRAWVLTGMLAVTAVGAFGLAPAMTALKASGALATDAAVAARFGRLHAWSSALFVANALLGLALVAAGPHRRDQAGSGSRGDSARR